MRELKRGGLSGALASKAVEAGVRATEADRSLLDACVGMTQAGKSDAAAGLSDEHIASLIACLPRECRKKYLNLVLKLAEGMEG